MKREFGVEAMSASRRSPIARPSASRSDQDYRFVSSPAGRGQYGHVTIKFEPNEAGKG